jgi:hypothetical protein
MEYVGNLKGHFVYFTANGIHILWHLIAIWYILWSFGIFSPFLVCCAEKNLATLDNTRKKGWKAFLRSAKKFVPFS